ncbi:MAG: response regulator [Planctomycetota bacterium]
MIWHARADDEERVHPRVDRHEPLPLAALPNLGGIRVLVVDDEIESSSVLRSLLEQCGAEVRDAQSAAQALHAAQEWRPALIVSDIGMPGEDGYTFMERYRAWEQTIGGWTPAVALTAYARGEDRVRALSAGYQTHVAKPVDLVEFALIVAGLLQRGRHDG